MPSSEARGQAASSPSSPSSPRGLVGLSNLGNTCYMNAALQCLLNTPALADFFLTCPALVLKADRPAPMARAFRKLVEDVQGRAGGREGGSYVAPLTVLYALKHAHPMFRGFQQHDSQEFLRCIMDLLHEELMEPIECGPDPDSEDEGGDDLVSPQQQQQHPPRPLDAGSGVSSPPGSDAEPEEYETADSGVSEQSSNDGDEHQEEEEEEMAAAAGEETDEEQQGQGDKKRKRKRSAGRGNGAGGLGCGGKRERDDVATLHGSESGLGSLSSASTIGGSNLGHVAAAGSSSDIELEFADALSSASGSPPLSSSPRLLPVQRSPGKAAPPPMAAGPLIQKRKPKTYKSIISDIFDGKLVSSVQCLTCDRISMTTEAFQDLSLPIPTSDTLSALRSQAQQQLQNSASSGSAAAAAASAALSQAAAGGGSGWLSWAWGWVSSWLYGPNITLVDCLSYFFSADELKGENMYSCEKCKKLRNGLKYSRVTVLPDTLCIHLKRFRHDFAFSSKVSTRVTFPLVDLDMAPWLHKESTSSVSLYDLTGVICHHGSAGGGHYTAYALNPYDQEWYEFDDSTVTKVEPAVVANAEAYVLFYRKNNSQMDPVREMASALLERARKSPSLVQFHVGKQWLNKFENLAEPGPVDNSDFLCRHGGVLPAKSAHAAELCVALPQPVWDLLRRRFGLCPSGPAACTVLRECALCRAELDALNRQKTFELEEFKALHAEFQEEAAAAAAAAANSGGSRSPPSTPPPAVYCLSSSWFKLWEGFVTNRLREPPGPIDNRAIVVSVKHQDGAGGGAGQQQQQQEQQQQLTLRQNSDYVQLPQVIWLMLHSIYGGGPEVVVRANGTVHVASAAAGAARKQQHLPVLAARLRSRANSESTAVAGPLPQPPQPPQPVAATAVQSQKQPPRPGVATRSKTRSACEMVPPAPAVKKEEQEYN